ncbi:Metallo-dependent phosphatase-like protein [Syncephalis fuscata]|nr:Metallo-dependent phosphatase-like protein [Syncephalis fuscata]
MSDSQDASSSSSPPPASSDAAEVAITKVVAPVSEEQHEQAEAVKTEANKLFQAKKYTEAIEKYSKAIELDSTVPAYYSNRAFAYIKTEAFGYAIADADKAIELDSSYAKAYYRRATANMALSHFKKSLSDFRMVVKRAPADKDARRQLVECEKIVRRIEFEKAIEVEDADKSVADSIDLDAMLVEDSYDGPRIKPEGIDAEFVDDMMERFRQEKKIHRKYAYQIVLAIREYMLEQPSLIEVNIEKGHSLTICGDVHGQFYDLLNIFKLAGKPSDTHHFLFNGDFVDRGSFSVEVVILLFAYKWLYPNGFFLTRGNHETKDMNRMYGFEGETKSKFSELMYKLFCETFDTLPLAHVVQHKLFVVHGGLFSRDDVTLDEIKAINRFRQPGSEGLMTELLWADPQELPGRSPSKRGVGLQFGPDVTETFLKNNNLEMVIRSHEVKDNGYVIEHNGKCVTVFSAPNYCDQMGNKGAYINVTDEGTVSYHVFESVPHPNVKPMQYASQYSLLGL